MNEPVQLEEQVISGVLQICQGLVGLQQLPFDYALLCPEGMKSVPTFMYETVDTSKRPDRCNKKGRSSIGGNILESRERPDIKLTGTPTQAG